MIIPGTPINIDVEPDNVVSGVIQLGECDKSYIFNLTPIGVGDISRVDLKVYMSLYFKEPEEYRCDKFIINVRFNFKFFRNLNLLLALLITLNKKRKGKYC